MTQRIAWIPPNRRLRSRGVRATRGTLLFLAATLLIGLVAIDSDTNLLLILFGLCLGAFVVTGLAGWLGLRRLVIRRDVPKGLTCGQTFELRYHVTQTARLWPACSLHLVDLVDAAGAFEPPEAFFPKVPPGGTVSVAVPCVCRRRGRIAFDQIAIGTRFPFGLFTRFVTVSIAETAVAFPRLGELHERRWAGAGRTDGVPDGAARTQRGDDEFVGLREFRTGDNPRRVHWRRSAGRRTLLVREMAQVRADQIWCVLDTRIPRVEPALADRLEAAISCLATVATDALELNHRVGLICNGVPLRVLPPANGRDFRLRLLRELAFCGSNHDDLLSARLRSLNWLPSRRGRCLVFAALANDDLPQSLRVLNQCVGPAHAYIPGSPAFDAIFTLGGGPGRRLRGPSRSRHRFGAARSERGVWRSGGRVDGPPTLPAGKPRAAASGGAS